MQNNILKFLKTKIDKQINEAMNLVAKNCLKMKKQNFNVSKILVHMAEIFDLMHFLHQQFTVSNRAAQNLIAR